MIDKSTGNTLIFANVESSQPNTLIALALTRVVSITDSTGFEQVVQLNKPLLDDHLIDANLSGAVLSLIVSVVFTSTVVSFGKRSNLNLKSFLFVLLLASFNSVTLFSSSNTSEIESKFKRGAFTIWVYTFSHLPKMI